MKREEWDLQRAAWAVAMKRAADSSDPRLKKCFGPIAWGRYEGEPSGADSKDRTIFGCGYLQGARAALLRVAEEFGLEGEVSLRRIHEAVNERSKASGRVGPR